MSYFAGIDYDSNAIHAVTIDEDTLQLVDHRRYDLAAGPGDAFDRARRARDLLPPRQRWSDTGVLAVGIEEPWTKQLNSLVALIRVQGAILSCLPRDLLVIPFPPNRRAPEGWKALTVGKTNASKDEIRVWAINTGCPEGLEEDTYDAYAIAHATAARWKTATRNRRAA